MLYVDYLFVVVSMQHVTGHILEVVMLGTPELN